VTLLSAGGLRSRKTSGESPRLEAARSGRLGTDSAHRLARAWRKRLGALVRSPGAPILGPEPQRIQVATAHGERRFLRASAQLRQRLLLGRSHRLRRTHTVEKFAPLSLLAGPRLQGDLAPPKCAPVRHSVATPRSRFVATCLRAVVATVTLAWAPACRRQVPPPGVFAICFDFLVGASRLKCKAGVFRPAWWEPGLSQLSAQSRTNAPMSPTFIAHSSTM